jgi:hypothetical protein
MMVFILVARGLRKITQRNRHTVVSLTVGAGDAIEFQLMLLLLHLLFKLPNALLFVLTLLHLVDARRGVVLSASTWGESAESTCKRSCWQED